MPNKEEIDNLAQKLIPIQIGNSVKPHPQNFEETLEMLKARKEVFSNLHYFLNDQERHYSEFDGFRPTAYHHNLIKAANAITGIPREHFDSHNFTINAILGSMYFSHTDGNIVRYRRSIQAEHIQDTIRSMSCYAALPGWLKKAVNQVPQTLRNDGSAGVRRFLFKKWLEQSGISPEAWHYAQMELWVNEERVRINETTKSTENPFIQIDNGKFIWLPAFHALYRFTENEVFNVLRVIGKVQAVRRAVKVALSKNESIVKGMTVEKLLWKLSEYRPQTWDSHPDLNGGLSKFASKRYPKGSLVGIEIEFVADRESPLNLYSDSCGDCEACNNDDSDNCENRDTGNAEWLQIPMVSWKTDGSISSNSDGQVVLPYQEMNVIGNIIDPNDWSRVDKTLDWMNSMKMEVNKTCGLHVHLDSRHCTPNMFGRKATKMEEAMITWIQFCVPFSRASNSYCKVFSDSRGDRYKAVNRTAFNKFSTLEIRIGSASLNKTKVKNWAKLLHYLFNTREDFSSIDQFLKTDASPEIKAFVISRICRFYETHLTGRTKESPTVDSIWNTPGTAHNKIPQEITDIYNTWKAVLQIEGNNS